MQQQVLPHSNDAEIAVLSSMISEPDKTIYKVLEILDEDCFYAIAHKIIFTAIVTIFSKDSAVTMLTVSEELRRIEQLEQAGGIHYLARLGTLGLPVHGVVDEAKIIFERFILRKLIYVSRVKEQRCFDPGADAFVEIESAEKETAELIDRLESFKSVPTMDSLSRKALDSIINTADGEILTKGILSGLNELDNLTMGFKPGDLVIVAARPSMGKTALGLNIALNAVLNNQKVGIFSLEMTSQSLYNRLLSSDAGISTTNIITNRLSHTDKEKLVESISKLSELPIYIEDSSDLNLMQLKAKAKRMKKEYGVSMVIIDYIQLMKPPKSESREQQISIISRTLKNMAKELEMPIVALAQLNREVEKRQNKTPVLSDLRESGSLEQDADIVLLLNRLDYYNVEYYDDGLETKDTAQIIVAKNREGATGTARVRFEKEYTRFSNRYAAF